MNDLNYYRNKMDEYYDKINTTKTEIKKCDSLLSALTPLPVDFSKIRDGLESASGLYLKGAYIDHEGPFDQGELELNSLNIDDSITSLEKIINHLKNRLLDLDSLLSYYEKEYELAKTDYNNCMRENGG